VVAGDAITGEARFRKRDMARIFASGFIINTLNPGVILFWLGNATALSASHTLQERIIIFSVCLLINMAADVGKVMAAGTLGRKLTVRTLSVINKIAGTILVGFGIALIWDVIVFHQLPK
jgi:threonine/homoserine/homoserine lactone efflux protein